MRIGKLLQACLGLAVVVTPQIGLSAQETGKPLTHFATAPHGERNPDAASAPGGADRAAR